MVGYLMQNLLWELIFIYCRLFDIVLVVFVVSSFTTFRPNFPSGDLPRPRIGMLSLVTVSPVITAFHSCYLSHHVFDQVNLWPACVGFETAIFLQCSPETVETQRLYPLRHGPRRGIKNGFFGLINPIICSPYLVFHRRTELVIVFNWNHFEMRLLNLRINFYLSRTFCPDLGRFFCCFFFHYVSAKFHLWPPSGDLLWPRIGMLSLVTVSPVITAIHSCS